MFQNLINVWMFLGFYLLSKLVSTMSTENTSSQGTHIARKSLEDGEALLESKIEKDPFTLFETWFSEANRTQGIQQANSMFLATVSEDGSPSGRMVLLKSFGKDGFVFFTNYNSRKGTELAANPKVSLAFYWEPLRKSVRIEGHVVKTSDKESEAYFQSRPYASKIGAIASAQSQPCESRDQMSRITEELQAKYKEGDYVPRPQHWGGYIVIPKRIEFWVGHNDKLHDRIVFTKSTPGEPLGPYTHEAENGWHYTRLFP